MKAEFITPIELMSFRPIMMNGTTNTQTENNIANSSFGQVFKNLYTDAKVAETDLVQKQYLLATGQIDDAHQVPIAAAKAELATSILVQVRNKAVESYNELMRINL